MLLNIVSSWHCQNGVIILSHILANWCYHIISNWLYHKSNETSVTMLSTELIHHINSIRSDCCCTTSQIKPVSPCYQVTEFTTSIPSGQTVVAPQVRSNQCHHVIKWLNSPHQFHQVRLLLHHKSDQTSVTMLSSDYSHQFHQVIKSTASMNISLTQVLNEPAYYVCTHASSTHTHQHIWSTPTHPHTDWLIYWYVDDIHVCLGQPAGGREQDVP